MDELEPRGQPQSTSRRATAAIYLSALATGAALIVSGHASPTEASGYVAPFLVIYERLTQR